MSGGPREGGARRAGGTAARCCGEPAVPLHGRVARVGCGGSPRPAGAGCAELLERGAAGARAAALCPSVLLSLSPPLSPAVPCPGGPSERDAAAARSPPLSAGPGAPRKMAEPPRAPHLSPHAADTPDPAPTGAASPPLVGQKLSTSSLRCSFERSGSVPLSSQKEAPQSGPSGEHTQLAQNSGSLYPGVAACNQLDVGSKEHQQHKKGAGVGVWRRQSRSWDWRGQSERPSQACRALGRSGLHRFGSGSCAATAARAARQGMDPCISACCDSAFGVVNSESIYCCQSSL